MTLPVEKLIKLNPFDSEEVFFSKLMRLPTQVLEKQLESFEKYAKYSNVLKSHLVLQKRPDLNVSMSYNKKNGFHLSSCDRSFPLATIENPCTCDHDMLHLDRFFLKLHNEKYIRCDLCKRYSPDWFEVKTEKNDGEDEPKVTAEDK